MYGTHDYINRTDINGNVRCRRQHECTMLERYHSGNINIKREELEGQKAYLHDREEAWNSALKELADSIREQEARDRGYQIE